MSYERDERTIPSKRTLQDEIKKRQAQAAVRRPQEVPRPAPAKTINEVPDVDAIMPERITLPKGGLGPDQIAKLIDSGYINEARDILRRRLYKDSLNPELWWLYARVAEDEDQLYQILNGLVGLPPNQYTARARAKLAQLGYRQPANPLKWGSKSQAIASLSNATQSVLRIKMLPVILIFAAVVVCLTMSFIVFRQSASGAAAPLPMQESGNLLGYLIKVGVPISNLQTMAVPNATWNGSQMVQFNVVRGSDKGTFMIISYDDPLLASRDSFTAAHNKNYSNWKLMHLSNVIILTSPETSESLQAEVSSHAMQYLASPYRPILPTATQGSAQ